MYRGVGGMKCAIGQLIPDDMYDSGMEGKSIYRIKELYPAIRELLQNVKHPLLLRMQYIHDHHSDPTNWRPLFERAAKDYNLQMPL